jgi:hypothetical protein
MTPEVYEKHETSRKTRNFTKNQKLHSITESSRKTGNPTKNRKPHEKPETLRKTQDFSDLEVYKKHAPARKTGTSGNPEISWQKRVYPEKVFQSFSEFSVLV